MHIRTIFERSYRKVIRAHLRGKNTLRKQELKLQDGATSKKDEEKSPIKLTAQFVVFQHTTVNKLHVVIDDIRREHPHTPPTNMRLTLRASHMVAAPVLLDQDFALWALLDVLVTLGPTLQQPLLGLRVLVCLPLLTAEPVVVLSAGHANRREARSAPENPTSRIRFEGVDFGAVWSGAVSELLGMASEVVEEGGFQQVLDLCRKKEPLYDRKGDRKPTPPLIAHTRQGELLGVGGGEEEVAKATVTVSVAASQTIWLVDGIVTNRANFSILELVLRSNAAR